MNQTPITVNDAMQGRVMAFIGGGNMATAIIGGLLKQGVDPERVLVVEPHGPQRDKLSAQWGVTTLEAAGPPLATADLVIWAVKPQTFKEAALACASFVEAALHLSVAAGIRSDSMQTWLRTERIVRAMPNTPALVGRGMTGLYARPGASPEDRTLIETTLGVTGQLLWVPHETDLDAVTALSGSGPAYVFYFLEAMRQAGTEMGLSPEVALQLAVGTFVGASHLAADAVDPPEVLRERVTSKGGTTHAALTAMDAAEMRKAFILAMHAAHHRARELGEAFGR